MPIYEYECKDKDCGHRMEKLQRLEDPAPTCSADRPTAKKTERRICGGEMRRLVSQTNFSLKGGGWADTGYA